MSNIEMTCKRINIPRSCSRSEIVQKVVNTFINTERGQMRPGTTFLYPVENLPKGQLFIRRPGGLQKWNFDFKVLVPEELGLGRGTHAEMLAYLKKTKKETPRKFKALLQALTEIYDCSRNDVDKILKKYSVLKDSPKKGASIEIFLKVIKWMFIMEDIVYWNYKGRTKLYEALLEAVGK